MKYLKELGLAIGITVILYIILTFPHIALVFFNFGIEYPLWLLLCIGFISGFSGTFISNWIINNKEK
jgi:hypothetical protein